MGNDRDSSDDGARDGAANDDAAAAPPDSREPAVDLESAAPAKPTIEVVTAEQARASGAARRPPRQIVQLGRRNPKSYLN